MIDECHYFISICPLLCCLLNYIISEISIFIKRTHYISEFFR